MRSPQTSLRMTISRRNPPADDGQRSPPAEEEKEEAVEEEDGSNGVGEVQGGQQRERGDDDLGQHDRNVRQNVGPPPPDWSRNNVELTTANLVPKQGTISGVAPMTQINPRATLISLAELMEKEDR